MECDYCSLCSSDLDDGQFTSLNLSNDDSKDVLSVDEALINVVNFLSSSVLGIEVSSSSERKKDLPSLTVCENCVKIVTTFYAAFVDLSCLLRKHSKVIERIRGLVGINVDNIEVEANHIEFPVVEPEGSKRSLRPRKSDFNPCIYPDDDDDDLNLQDEFAIKMEPEEMDWTEEVESTGNLSDYDPLDVPDDEVSERIDNPDLYCPPCGKGFSTKETLARHMKRHTNPSRLQCPACEKTLSRRDHLIYHIRRSHKGENVEIPPPSSTAKKLPIKSVDSKKDVDSENYSGSEDANYNSLGSNDNPDLPCSSFATKDRHGSHMNRNTSPNPFPNLERPMSPCEKTVSRKGRLKNHLKKDRKEHPPAQPQRPAIKDVGNIECPHCPQKYSHESGLRRHIRIHHNPEAIFTRHTCPDESCGRSYARSDDLNKHMRKLHNFPKMEKRKCKPVKEPRPPRVRAKKAGKAECPQCGSVMRANRLAEHLRAHTGERPHLCQFCGKSFLRRGALRLHMRDKHEDDSAKHNCPHCSSSFTRKSILAEHIKAIHENSDPFPCKYCGKLFLREKNLKAHLKGHSEETDGPGGLKCPICSKIVSSHYGNLALHIRTVHQGEKVTRKSKEVGPSRKTVAKHTRGEFDNTQDDSELL